MVVPQVIQNWTILALKPMALGIHRFKNPPHVNFL